MNDALKEIMQAFESTEYSELVDVAKEAIAIAYPYITKVFADQEIDENLPVKTILHFIATTIAVDGNYTELEHKFFCDVTGDTDSYEDNKAFIAQFADGKHADVADQLFDYIVNDNDAKAALLQLCLAICAVDKTISPDEVAFICKLID